MCLTTGGRRSVSCGRGSVFTTPHRTARATARRPVRVLAETLGVARQRQTYPDPVLVVLGLTSLSAGFFCEIQIIARTLRAGQLF